MTPRPVFKNQNINQVGSYRCLRVHIDNTLGLGGVRVAVSAPNFTSVFSYTVSLWSGAEDHDAGLHLERILRYDIAAWDRSLNVQLRSLRVSAMKIMESGTPPQVLH